MVPKIKVRLSVIVQILFTNLFCASIEKLEIPESGVRIIRLVVRQFLFLICLQWVLCTDFITPKKADFEPISMVFFDALPNRGAEIGIWSEAG